MNQRQEHVNSSLNSILGVFSSRFQEWESQFQSVKQANELEIVRINEAKSSLEAKIATWLVKNNRTAIQQSAMVRTTAVGLDGSGPVL